MSNIKKLYSELMPAGGFIFDHDHSNIEDGQWCYSLSPEKGEGFFWNYFYEDMFVIEKQNFRFHENFFLESREPEFISVQYFFSVSGEELHPYRQLSPNSLRGYVGGNNKTFQAIYHKDIPIHSIGISILPDFYHHYLKEKLGGEYIDPRNAFRRIMRGIDFPQLVALLKQIHSYTGEGVSARLFYEGKILEALALILDQARQNENRSKKNPITKSDEENLKVVGGYLDHHYGFSTSTEQLCKIACMGDTQLRSKFKEYYGCSITDYIIQKRMNQAQHFLIATDLSIGEIAKAVGYDRSDSFARQFQKVTGLLPREYRKMVN